VVAFFRHNFAHRDKKKEAMLMSLFHLSPSRILIAASLLLLPAIAHAQESPTALSECESSAAYKPDAPEEWNALSGEAKKISDTITFSGGQLSIGNNAKAKLRYIRNLILQNNPSTQQPLCAAMYAIEPPIEIIVKPQVAGIDLHVCGSKKFAGYVAAYTFYTPPRPNDPRMKTLSLSFYAPAGTADIANATTGELCAEAFYSVHNPG